MTSWRSDTALAGDGRACPRGALAGALASCSAGCGRPADPVIEVTGPTMGTYYAVKVPRPPAGLDARGAAGRDRGGPGGGRSRRSPPTTPDSELSRLNRNPSTDWIPVSPNLLAVLAGGPAHQRPCRRGLRHHRRTPGQSLGLRTRGQGRRGAAARGDPVGPGAGGLPASSSCVRTRRPCASSAATSTSTSRPWARATAPIAWPPSWSRAGSPTTWSRSPVPSGCAATTPRASPGASPSRSRTPAERAVQRILPVTDSGRLHLGRLPQLLRGGRPALLAPHRPQDR